ncbi:MAG TPA: protein phosphatase CheZ [Gammaproteobacteria bacterium]|nr:protein phosphatase CheZ [Gammaproteobacteria bacterium]
MEAATKPCSTVLLDQARELVHELESGNMPAAESLIEQLSQIREQSLFQELGKMTRQLHDSLSNFALDARVQSLAESDIPDAKARLNHVIEMTESSANRTLTAVEATLPIAEQLQSVANTLHEKWGRFRNKAMNVEEFRSMSKEIDEFLSVTKENAGQIHNNLSEVMMAQEFQDLTGQILRRVITLVQEVEENLVELIRLSGGREEETGSATPAVLETAMSDEVMQGIGPQVPGVEDGGGSVSGQDEVDDLLSSLGF